jgi:hypothetical protein
LGLVLSAVEKSGFRKPESKVNGKVVIANTERNVGKLVKIISINDCKIQNQL